MKLYFKLICFIYNFIYFLLYRFENFILKRGPETHSPKIFKNPSFVLQVVMVIKLQNQMCLTLQTEMPITPPWLPCSASSGFMLNLNQRILPSFLAVIRMHTVSSQFYLQAFVWLVLVSLNKGYCLLRACSVPERWSELSSITQLAMGKLVFNFHTDIHIPTSWYGCTDEGFLHPPEWRR